jgi:3-deoxy-manno-octulosonate cytidylyltransferase (CMP-KDO synthetase)
MHVVERASRAALVSRVIVATDDQRIADAVEAHGGEVRMTSAQARSGTDRVAEVARSIDAEIIVNVQGDEPLIFPSTIDSAIEALIEDPETQMSTTSEPMDSIEDVFNSDVVKVVTDARQYALYFSRSPIPYIRPVPGLTLEESLRRDATLVASFRKHSGLYAYRSAFLQSFARLTQSRLEKLESLEQLRALENGFRVRVVEVAHRSIGVDTEQDYHRVKKMVEENSYD